jgi:hypothetical protein
VPRRDGFEGWSRGYEKAFDRVFLSDNPTPHDIDIIATRQRVDASIRERVNDETLRHRPSR